MFKKENTAKQMVLGRSVEARLRTLLPTDVYVIAKYFTMKPFVATMMFG